MFSCAQSLSDLAGTHIPTDRSQKITGCSMFGSFTNAVFVLSLLEKEPEYCAFCDDELEMDDEGWFCSLETGSYECPQDLIGHAIWKRSTIV